MAARRHFSGFSEVSPWLPIAPAHQALAVDVQESDADSMLNGYRRFLAWRKLHPVLVEGDINLWIPTSPILALFSRTLGELKIFVGFNRAIPMLSWIYHSLNLVKY